MMECAQMFNISASFNSVKPECHYAAVNMTVLLIPVNPAGLQASI